MYHIFNVSRVLNEEDRKDANGVSTLFVQMGQFIDHDISLTTEHEIDCCEENNRGEKWLFPTEFDKLRCAPIQVPTNDPVWGSRGRRCIEFRR